MRFKAEDALLTRMGLNYNLLDSGCCGMAGSFGFEPDKYDISIKCGERVLLPAVRKAEPDTLIIADGFSCKTQISETTNRHALHLAQILQMAKREGREGPKDKYPERRYLQPEVTNGKAGPTAAQIGLAAGAALAGGALLLALTNRNRS